MHPSVQKLLALQKVDQQIASLRKDIDSLPAEEARRRRRLDDLDKVRTERKEALARAEVDVRTMDKTIKQSDDEVKKLTDRLNVVRNNAEYQAILFQIESVKKERSKMEEEGLALLEQLEQLRAVADRAGSAYAEEERVFAGFQREAADLVATRKQAIERKATGRPALLEGIPRDLLELYERLFGARDGLAIAAAQISGNVSVCQGCYTKVTTSDHARLLGGTAVVQCKSCQRILYPSE